MSVQAQLGPPTTNLDTLSNEMISMIIASARPEDIPALRLTCKQLHGNSTKHFAAAFTTDVKLIVSRKSLQSMIDISAHPVYAPLVRSITIDTVGIGGTMGLLSSGREFRKGIRRAENQASLKTSGKAVDMLTRALRNLKAFENVSLGMGDHLEGSIGYKSFWGFMSLSTREHMWQCDRDFVLELLLDATRKSRHSFNHFKLNTTNEGVSYEVHDEPYEIGNITLPSRTREILAGACGLLKILEINVSPSIFGLPMVTIESVSRLISLSSGVKDLTLRLGMDYFNWNQFFDCSISTVDDSLSTPDPQYVLHKFGTATASMKLERLCLLHVIGYYTDFQTLLQDHCNTLQALDLTGCILWGLKCWKAESWSCLLRFLLENLHLRELKIHSLSVAGSCELEEDYWGGYAGNVEDNELEEVSSQSAVLFGEEEVKTWLNQELDRLADIERCHREKEIQRQLDWEAEETD